MLTRYRLKVLSKVIFLSLFCAAHLSAQGANTKWRYQKVVDDTGGINPYFAQKAVALAPDESPHVIYEDKNSLNYAWKNAGGWHRERIASSPPYFGSKASILFNSTDSTVHICYVQGSGNVYHAYRDSGGWHISTAATAGYNFSGCSMKFDGSHALHMAVAGDGFLQYGSVVGGEWTYETVTAGSTSWPTLQFDGSGSPRIVYLGTVPMYAYKAGGEWRTESVSDSEGAYPDLVLDSAGNPYVSFLAGTVLQFASRSAAGTWSVVSPNPAMKVGTPVLGITPSDQPALVYGDTTTDRLIYALLSGGSWYTEVLDQSHIDWWLDFPSPALTFSSDGRPFACYSATYRVKCVTRKNTGYAPLGSIRMTTNHGAKAYIDGQYIYWITNVGLRAWTTPGTHRVRAVGYNLYPITRRVRVRANRTTRVRLNMRVIRP